MKRIFLLAGLLALLGRPAAADDVVGKVAETMDSGGYTYARVANGDVSIWVAAPQMKLKVGQAVSFEGGMIMKDFESPSLHRKFDKIIFSSGLTSAKGAAPAGLPAGHPTGTGTPAGMMGGHSGAKSAKDASAKTPKAEGADAYTVSELWAKRADLAGKTAVVRGKVVKVNMQVMDRNFVHLQDGTGAEKAGDFDLTATTDQELKVGDVVTLKGVIAKDRNFGMGYKYPVLLEKAAVVR